MLFNWNGTENNDETMLWSRIIDQLTADINAEYNYLLFLQSTYRTTTLQSKYFSKYLLYGRSMRYTVEIKSKAVGTKYLFPLDLESRLSIAVDYQSVIKLFRVGKISKLVCLSWQFSFSLFCPRTHGSKACKEKQSTE